MMSVYELATDITRWQIYSILANSSLNVYSCM